MMSYISKPEDALDYLREHIETQRKKLETEILKPRKFEDYGAAINIALLGNWTLKDIDDSGNRDTNRWTTDYNQRADTAAKIVARRDSLYAALDRCLVTAKDIRVRNNEIAKHNAIVRERITLLMTAMGVPTSYSKTERVRGRDKSVTHQAGYLGDIARVIPTVDRFGNVEAMIKAKRATVEKWANDALHVIRDTEKARKDAEQEKKRTLFLATLRVRYGLDYEADEDEVLATILMQDKYLRLAHYLLRNRTDWNDGPDFAEVGLNGFDVADDLDREVADAVQKRITDWGGDDRVFRDMKWGYEALFVVAGERNTEAYDAYQTYIDLFPLD